MKEPRASPTTKDRPYWKRLFFFFLTEDQTEDLVREKIMGVIRRQFQDFDGQFSYAARRNRNVLTLAADQNLDARGVRTLKGNGSVYVVLDSPATPTDEVSHNP